MFRNGLEILTFLVLFERFPGTLLRITWQCAHLRESPKRSVVHLIQFDIHSRHSRSDLILLIFLLRGIA